MFYKVTVKDYIRVPPRYFNINVKEAVIKRIKKKFEGYISPDLGFVIDVADVHDMKDGVVVAGDGASYYETQFDLLVFRPEMQEVLVGQIKDVADFGAFINLGPTKGMIHVSQTMDDFVSFSKDGALSGKESGKSLKAGDHCRARVIAVSYKDVNNPKLGLTMRQERLGKLDWLNESKEKNTKEKAAKE